MINKINKERRRSMNAIPVMREDKVSKGYGAFVSRRATKICEPVGETAIQNIIDSKRGEVYYVDPNNNVVLEGHMIEAITYTVSGSGNKDRANSLRPSGNHGKDDEISQEGKV
jgi:hypothetical protein